MIIKYYELNYDFFNKNNFFLFYGNNQGLKNEIINNNLKKSKIIYYDEKEILENEENFIENILSKSLFDEKRTIVIKRSTDKICKLIDKIKEKNIDDETLIFISENLEKKSKLRSFFEKEKNFICVPFYPDNDQTLLKLAHNFLRQKKISLSTEIINLIIKRSTESRENLSRELTKIEYFCKNGKKPTSENIRKLINLTENHSISELVNNCLAKNKTKIINIFNENIFTGEDCILIIRSLIIQSKKVLKLSNEFQKSKNLDLVIDTAKPPIFWKDKEITKQQVFKWEPKKLKNLIYKLNETELIVKKNYNNSVNLVTNFLLEQTS